MIRHRITALLVLAIFTLVTSGCASSVRIHSDPEGAQVFIDGMPIGYTPTTYSDTGIILSTREVELRLDGYEVHRGTLRRDANINVGATVVGLLCVWPLLLWAMDYPSAVRYQLRPLHGENSDSSGEDRFHSQVAMEHKKD